VLVDATSNQVLASGNADERVEPASLTKLMTAYLVFEALQTKKITMDQTVMPSEAVRRVKTDESRMFIEANKPVTVHDLVYGMIIQSGNDAAIALAQHVAGSESRFVQMMNARAKRMALSCSHFSSASGVVDQGNYSCAPDLAVLAHAVVTQPLLGRIVGSRSAILPFPIKGGKLFLYNNNPLLLSRYPGADGVKTGYTQAAGQCLVATARRGNTWLGVVLLHSDDAADQAQQLLNAGFARFGVP
jgi:D-alanyl-D-alanine carboxypeptidase (penicillin-binding protein 5/6)